MGISLIFQGNEPLLNPAERQRPEAMSDRCRQYRIYSDMIDSSLLTHAILRLRKRRDFKDYVEMYTVPCMANLFVGI